MTIADRREAVCCPTLFPPGTSHTELVNPWTRAPQPIAELAPTSDSYGDDELKRAVKCATMTLCLGLAIGLARCRARGVAPPKGVFAAYDKLTVGGFGIAIEALERALPGSVGWNLDAPCEPARPLIELMGASRKYRILDALQAVATARNRWAHLIDDGAPHARNAGDAPMLPRHTSAAVWALVRANRDFEKPQRLLVVVRVDDVLGRPTTFRARHMRGPHGEEYRNGADVPLPSRVERPRPGEVILWDENSSTHVSLDPFVVGDRSGLWVLWSIDRVVELRRFAAVAPPDVVARAREDVATQLQAWTAATSLARVKRAGVESAKQAMAITTVDPAPPEPEVAQMARVLPRTRFGLRPRHVAAGVAALVGVMLVAAVVFAASIASTPSVVRVGAVPTPSIAPAGISSARIPPPAVPADPIAWATGLPLRFGMSRSEVEGLVGRLPGVDLDECGRRVGLVEIGELPRTLRSSLPGVDSAGATFDRDYGLYELVLRSSATVDAAVQVVTLRLGVANDGVNTWRAPGGLRARVASNHGTVVRFWIGTVAERYSTARASCEPRR